MNTHVPPPMAQAQTMCIGPDGQLRPLRFDPAGASIGPEVPETLIVRWKEMLASNATSYARLHKNYERFFKDQEACIGVMIRLLQDASDIADNLRDLANLFDMALNSDGVEGKLAEALRLVTGSVLTMADRIAALEEQGDAARGRYHV